MLKGNVTHQQLITGIYPASFNTAGTEVGGFRDAVAYLKVTGAPGMTATPKLDVKLQDSPNGTDWYDVSTAFTEATGATSERKLATGLGAYLRGVVTITGTATDVTATGTLTSDNTNVAAGATVTIGTVTYAFATDLTSNVPNKVVIGVDADTSLVNLAAAINHGTGEGTTYGTGTVANPAATSSASVTSHHITITAVATNADGNTVATTETSPHLSFGATTLTGGVTAGFAFTLDVVGVI